MRITALAVILLVVRGALSFNVGRLRPPRASSLKMLLHDPHSLTIQLDQLQHLQSHWSTVTSHVIADASGVVEPMKKTYVCPAWGEPGWAPFCFLNGNPVFNAFDTYQAFIQNSIVTLRDFYHDKLGLKEAYGPSIISFTVLIRLLILPLTFKQLKTSSQTAALQPKIKEIQARFPDNKEVQNQLVALLYQETNTNPFAGCLPALIQIPVFLALYRSFLALASTNQMAESFLWLPDLEGPVYGSRSTDWLFKFVDGVPPLGWHDTLLYLTVPLMLFVAQSISLNYLSPPSDDPTVKKTQAILKYLPVLLAYFSLSVPAGLGVYWITNNALSTLSTVSIKEYYKRNQKALDFDIDSMITDPFYKPDWGYTSRDAALAEARINEKTQFSPKIPESFVA